MKILLIKYRNIGDVLLCTPLIENLKLNYPNAQIDFALNDYCIDMITNNPNISNIFPYHRSTLKNLSIFKRIKEELKYFKNIKSIKYDIAINLTKGDRGSFLAMFSGAKIKIGYKSDNLLLKLFSPFTYSFNNETKHTVEKDLDALLLLNKKIFNKKVSIYYNLCDQKKIDVFLTENNIKKFVHIHPVSRWMFKCWEDDRLAKIIDYITYNKKYSVILTASDDIKEKNKIRKIISLCEHKPYDLSGQLTLKELSYLSKKSSIFFGIDSAPMHIAAAVNTPIVALMGASRADIWGPWCNEAQKNYTQNEKIQKIGKNSIITSTDNKIFYEKNIKKSKGMVKIKYQTVKELINEKI
ncbi:MAG: putative lipopolysaccharide heptosyltransferase III [Sulfurospirillum sp.]